MMSFRAGSHENLFPQWVQVTNTKIEETMFSAEQAEQALCLGPAHRLVS